MWASGIRPPKIEDEWHPLVLKILSYKFHESPSRGRTEEAENGLAIAPSCYWYVWRADELYGEVVFLWREGAVPLRDSDGGVAPFDSGGFWHGFVRTSTVFADDVEKRSFFASICVKVSEWRTPFFEYVTSNYDDARDYVEGRTPAVGTPGIVRGAPNAASAWTWEARIARAEYRMQVVIDSIYWVERDRFKFEQFLASAPLDDDEMTRIAAMIEEQSIMCPIGLAPGHAARERLGTDLAEALKV